MVGAGPLSGLVTQAMLGRNRPTAVSRRAALIVNELTQSDNKLSFGRASKAGAHRPLSLPC